MISTSRRGSLINLLVSESFDVTFKKYILEMINYKIIRYKIDVNITIINKIKISAVNVKLKKIGPFFKKNQQYNKFKD